MSYVDPEYINKNGVEQYTPEVWLDEVKDTISGETIQEGTLMDAEHFNHIEQGIHNNALLLAILSEAVMHNKRAISAVDGELIEVSLANNKDFYFNNSAKTVALGRIRSTLDYRVFAEIQGSVTNVGEIMIYDKQLNGFKVAYTGSAKNVTVKCFVQGGL